MPAVVVLAAVLVLLLVLALVICSAVALLWRGVSLALSAGLGKDEDEAGQVR